MSKLKERREEQGLTQVEVAEKADVSVRLYQRYEAQEVKPSVANALKIASVLKTTVEALF